MEAISIELVSEIQAGYIHQLVIILKIGEPIIVEGWIAIDNGMIKFDRL